MTMSRFDQMSQETKDRLLRVSRKAQTKSLPYLNFNGQNNNFWLNGKPVLHSQWIALADETAASWCRFVNKQLIEKTPTVCLYTHDEPERPHSFEDRKQWPISDKYGTARDPWTFQLELPLQQVETGELAIFTSSNEWTRQSIGAVIEYFARTRRRPIIQLELRETTVNDNTVFSGALDIVAPDESDEFVVDLVRGGVLNEPAAGNSTVAKATADDSISTGNGSIAPPKKNADMDDDIPF